MYGISRDESEQLGETKQEINFLNASSQSALAMVTMLLSLTHFNLELGGIFIKTQGNIVLPYVNFIWTIGN
jgi:hypothetical protein